MTRLQRTGALVASLGSIVGVAAAVAVPRTTGATIRERPFATLPGPVKTAPSRRLERTGREHSVELRLKAGTLAEEVRRDDPAGGAPWVLRSFIADRLAPIGAGKQRVVGTSPCFQLGREVGGTFGWIDGENTFRPVRTSSNGGAPTRCVSPTLLRRHEVELELTTLVGNPTTAERSILGSVVWGSTGGPVDAFSLRSSGRERSARPSDRRGGFLSFYGPSHSPSDVGATTRYADGKTTRTTLMSRFNGPGSSMPAGRDIFPEVDPSTRRIIARAPDPGGGPSVGLNGVRSKSGVWCVGEVGSIVGDRVGTIDPVLGLLGELDASLLSSGCPTKPGEIFPPGQVLTVGGTGGGGEDPDQTLLDPARAALRLQPGRSMLYGKAREDVKLITITTSRDVRSLVPSSPAHAFLVSYDGTFSSGGIEIVATLEGGSTRTTKLNFGW